MNNRDEVNRLIRSVERLAEDAAQDFTVYLRDAGEEILLDVKTTRGNRGVPKDTSALADSGRVERTQIRKREVKISFGGAAAPYALAQHERTDYFHPQGEARYLVRGLERYEPSASGARALFEMNVMASIMAGR